MEIKKYKPTDHKIKALIYGGSGMGKTTFGGTAPNCIFASAEAGMLSLGGKDIDFVDIKTIIDLKQLYEYLKKGGHPYESVVIDSISEINDIIKMELEKKRGRPLQLQDWGVIAKTIESTLRDFRSLNMHVIFIAQEKEINDETKIAKIVPMLNGQSATRIAYFMDIVGYIETNSAGDHVVNTLPDPKYLCKDRTGLIGNGIEPDFRLWIKALEKMVTGEQAVVYSEDIKVNFDMDGQEKKGGNKKEVDPQEIYVKAYEGMQGSKTLDELKDHYTVFYKNKKYLPKEQQDEIEELKTAIKESLSKPVENMTPPTPKEIEEEIKPLLPTENIPTKYESLEDVEQEILQRREELKNELGDYNNNLQNPTDIDQFKKALAKQKKKIAYLKKGLMSIIKIRDKMKLSEEAKNLSPNQEEVG
ncbi:AAA family ATPase [Candidatus Gracilibacteria bacterium]|nr:AAA family ATPase [Candidatus Gracilibacteria bacterium]